jgi:AcrR family transcriptional regulator
MCQDLPVSAPAETDDRAPSRGEARRAAIQKAAIEEFASHGLRRTSMADIARAAGISRPALYQYFRDKDEVIASGDWDHMLLNFLDKMEATNNTAWALTEQGLSFVAAKNLHSRQQLSSRNRLL